MIMSDTPPTQFFTRAWLGGLILAVALGAALARWVIPRALVRRRDAWLPRAVAAVAEAGLFIVLPATAVWQAATARGWTTTLTAHAAVGAPAVLAATTVATLVWQTGGSRRRAAVTAAVLAAGYAVTGSGIVALLGALVVEFAAPTARAAAPEPVGGDPPASARRRRRPAPPPVAG